MNERILARKQPVFRVDDIDLNVQGSIGDIDRI
jgi:hypothetical protein